MWCSRWPLDRLDVFAMRSFGVSREEGLIRATGRQGTNESSSWGLWLLGSRPVALVKRRGDAIPSPQVNYGARSWGEREGAAQ